MNKKSRGLLGAAIIVSGIIFCAASYPLAIPLTPFSFPGNFPWNPGWFSRQPVSSGSSQHSRNWEKSVETALLAQRAVAISS